jgi:thiol-disulfide isomerase/thioredoxin
MSFLLVPTAHGRLTREEKMQLKQRADEADKLIHFLPAASIDQELNQHKTFILFFGANWCSNTQRFNPKYLEVQQRVEQADLKAKGFGMAKVECSGDMESTCVQKYKVDGYPTVFSYVDGKRKEEYPFADEVDELYSYINELIRLNPVHVPSRVVPSQSNQVKEVNAPGRAVQAHHDPVLPSIAPLPVKEAAVEVPKSTDSAAFLSWPILLLVGVVAFAGLTYYRANRSKRYRRVDNV